MESGENSKGSLAGGSTPAQFRVFLASPGGVPLERKLAREAIIHISSERRFRGHIIAWDPTQRAFCAVFSVLVILFFPRLTRALRSTLRNFSLTFCCF
jgi:hypothetical protein